MARSRLMLRFLFVFGVVGGGIIFLMWFAATTVGR
jgi:hypothetical protein